MHYYNLKVAAPRVCDKESVGDLIKKIDETLNGKSKEKKLKQKDIFEMKNKEDKPKKNKQKKNAKKDINKLDEKLKKHSKTQTKNHMKIMKKFIADGDSFAVAHRKALLEDKKKTKY